jgi:hypothetical protein
VDDDSGRTPVTFDHCDHVEGPFLHGTAALLQPDDQLVAGRTSNFQAGRVMNHVYFTTLESTAAYGAQLAAALTGAEGRGHVYIVEPTGPFEDDPNVTDKRLPGNPTRSYRTRAPLRVVEELTGWEGHPPERIVEMLAGLAQLREQGRDVIED